MANKTTTKRANFASSYDANAWGETELMREFYLQRDDSRSYFFSNIKPRLDRSYKLYIAYNGDRQKEIQKWQANIFVPYIQAVVETLMPRILDARPDFGVQGRTPESQAKAYKLEYLLDYYWEKAGMDSTTENLVRSAMIYGTGFLQAYWKKDVRNLKFLRTNDLTKKLVWKEEERTFYDAPSADWVDNYMLWYDWRNREAKEKRFWFKRLVLSKQEIERRYPYADPKKMALITPGGDIFDYAQVRIDVKSNQQKISRGMTNDPTNIYNTVGVGTYFQANSYNDLYEVFEWHRPLDDKYSVMVNNVPILKGDKESGVIPNPYNFKETPFIAVPYLKVPGEFEGYGLPMILENPQIMLNMIKNQRLDAVTLNIHKMWIVNPLANIDKKELVTRPFGIIYSTDPNGVREVQFSDIKQSAYQEEKLIKDDMRYTSGVDDFSMGMGGGASSATEVRHLREATIERVRLFVNHLGESFTTLQHYWISMTQQFFTKDMTLRIIGKDGQVSFPLIARDDVMGEFDFKATVQPSIAGQNEIKKKQDMDLLQLLLNTQGVVDPKKLIAKVLYDWDWDYNELAVESQPNSDGQAPQGEPVPQDSGLPPQTPPVGAISPDVMEQAMSLLGGPKLTSSPNLGSPSGFSEAKSPITLDPNMIPPTAPAEVGAPALGRLSITTNSRGLNRGGGRVNTNIPTGNGNSSVESALMNRSNNIQR